MSPPSVQGLTPRLVEWSMEMFSFRCIQWVRPHDWFNGSAPSGGLLTGSKKNNTHSEIHVITQRVKLKMLFFFFFHQVNSLHIINDGSVVKQRIITRNLGHSGTNYHPPLSASWFYFVVVICETFTTSWDQFLRHILYHIRWGIWVTDDPVISMVMHAYTHANTHDTHCMNYG